MLVIEFQFDGNPSPSLGGHGVGGRLQLLLRETNKQFGIGEESSALGIEQVAHKDAASGFISLLPDEHSASVIRTHLTFVQH